MPYVFILTFVCTVNLTLSLSLNASDISTTSDVSVSRSTLDSFLPCIHAKIDVKFVSQTVRSMFHTNNSYKGDPVANLHME